MSAVTAKWALTRLGDICEFKYGKSLPETARAGGDISVFGSNGVVGAHNSALTEGPTIVIGRKGSHGEVNFSPASCWPIDTTYYVDRSATKADIRWLFHRLCGAGLNQMNRAAAVPGLNREDAYRVEILLPPLEEQRRIAAILDQAETLRTQRRTALALLDSLTQSLFLDLLECAGSDVKRVAVEDAMDAIIDYRGKTPEKTTQGVPLVTAKVVKNGELLEPDEFIAEDAYDDWMQRGFPEAGDVLFTTEAPLGEVAQLDGRKVALAQRLLVLRGKHGLLQNTFLRFALTSWEVRRQIETRATGSTVKGIRQKELRQVELPIPPFALQQTFATRIASIEALKATHRRALAALDALFASLQQRAFTGAL